jgi:hypothetical protein
MHPRPNLSKLVPDAAGHQIARALAMRGLGTIYLIAFASWGAQARLLVGEDGLMPAARLLEWLGPRLAEDGKPSFLALPNLFWFTGASDTALLASCLAGCVLAAFVMAGRLVGPSLATLWFLYLSLVNTGGVFMSYQWDILLLESGLLFAFLCPWGWKMSWKRPPSLSTVNRAALFFAWFLVAKLMFFSGWVKLAWASEASPQWWPAGTAMSYHYMTQPIPTWTSWWMHQLPLWFHKASLFPMYLIELVLPFAVLLGRRGRLAAAIGFAGLMALILLTGNYTYFNWLTIILCLPLVHDAFWPKRLLRLLRIEVGGCENAGGQRRFARTRLAVAAPALTVLALVNLHIVLRDFHQAPRPLLKRDLSPGWLEALAGAMGPFHPASGYGLFRTMTTERPEIVLEGSSDGLSWFAYEFRWKVDAIDARPRFVAPHQPRLAWQFWFAALEGRYDPRSRNAPWFEALATKLFAGDAATKRFLRRDPFPDSPPRLLRARLMRYEFTTTTERRERGNWWKRVVVGEYLREIPRPAGKNDA